MNTDDLIRTLAADNDWRATPTGTALLIALGVRPDFTSATHNPFFDLKFAVMLALAISAILVVLPLSRPGSALGGRAWLLLVPVALLAAGIGFDLMMPQTTNWSDRMVG